MKAFSTFINSSAGLLVLGFVLTSGLGALLNYMIQGQRSENERGFEMYKTRLAEAKTLQTSLLEQSTTRLFYLEQLFGRLDDPPEDTQTYWLTKYTAVKDDWNKKVVNFHAQMRILFTGNLPNLLYSDAEDPVSTNHLVEENLRYLRDEGEFERKTPRTLHGAFIHAHATMYDLVFVCRKNLETGCKEGRGHLIELARRQLVHLKLLHNCLSYGISGQLLVDPYGPRKAFEMPKQCEVFASGA